MINDILTNQRISIDDITNSFEYWKLNHPIYRDKYPYDYKSTNIELKDVELYNTHIFVNIFEEFLKSDKDINKPLFMSLWSEDGSSFIMHRLTPEQKIKYNLGGNFMFISSMFKSCPLSKLVSQKRKKFPNSFKSYAILVNFYTPRDNNDV
jgi:hypothetical protein